MFEICPNGGLTRIALDDWLQDVEASYGELMEGVDVFTPSDDGPIGELTFCRTCGHAIPVETDTPGDQFTTLLTFLQQEFGQTVDYWANEATAEEIEKKISDLNKVVDEQNAESEKAAGGAPPPPDPNSESTRRMMALAATREQIIAEVNEFYEESSSNG